MKYVSLEEKMNALGGPVPMLRNSPVGPYNYPIAAEFSNWRDEQESWRKTAALMDQSVHMTDQYISGPDVVKLLSAVGVNSFNGFGRNKAKQLVVCNHDGYVIGDAVLFGHEDDKVSIVGRPPTCNWVAYQAMVGKYDVSLERDERALDNSRARLTYRYQVQGPTAWAILEKCNGAPLPDIPFFRMGEITIAGHRVRALRHGFAGAPGLELWGPASEGAEVRAALMEVGADYGLRAIGARAYTTVAIESGWLPSPLPAIYSGERLRPYRQWLGSKPGTEVALLWGEKAGGSAKLTVERHVQTEIRATVAPSPYSIEAREQYRPFALEQP